MSFCGYHPAMSEGLAKFGEGVAKSTLQKAEAAGTPIGAHLEVELVQLDALVSELQAIENQSRNQEAIARARVLKGLALVCQACFWSARGINDPRHFFQHFSTEFTRYGELVRKLEDAYEGCSSGTGIEERTRIGVKAAISGKPIAVS